MITSIHHSCMVVADMERSLGFYRDLLGMAVAMDQVVSGPALDQMLGVEGVRLRCVELQAGDRGPYFELLQYYNPKTKPIPSDLRYWDGGACHIGVVVLSIEQAYEKLKSHGVAFVSAPQRPEKGLFEGVTTAYCFDPDGVVVQLMQLPPR